MVKKVAFINFKGGVGKTTLTVEIAARLAWEYHKKVLLIDMDPQNNATFYLMSDTRWEGVVAKSNKTLKALFEAYLSGTPDFKLEEIILKNFYINNDTGHNSLPTLSLISNHLEMMGIEADLAYEIGREVGKGSSEEGLRKYHEVLHILKNAISPIEKDYDYIFFDCPPSVGLLTQNALVAAEKYVIPVYPDYLSTIGIGFLRKRVEEMVNRVNTARRRIGINTPFNGPQPGGIILCRVQVLRWIPLVFISPQQEIYEMLQRPELGVSHLIFKSFLSGTGRIQECASEHIPIAIRSGNKYAQWREQVGDITREFMTRVV
jgi:chromosome partitioning protein